MNGQKLQGVLTSYEVQAILKQKGWESQYPLISTIFQICDQVGQRETRKETASAEHETEWKGMGWDGMCVLPRHVICVHLIYVHMHVMIHSISC